MALKKVLLGTSALLGVGMMAGISPASAGTVTTASPFDLTINGYMRFDAVGGAIGDRQYTSPNNSSFDFRTDNRLAINAKAKDESTGIDYGFEIRIDAQAGANANGGNGNNIDVDEAWTWMRGSFGEFRFGDGDSVTHNMSLGAWSIAVGTGGLDGTLVDLEATTFVGDQSDSTKITYYSPTIAGFQLGLGYMPHANSDGPDFAVNNPPANTMQDYVDAGLTYSGNFGAMDLKASVVGNIARASSNNDESSTGIQPGVVLSFGGFSIAGAYGYDDIAGAKNQFYNLGAATTLGPVALSINWGQVLDTNNQWRQTNPVGLPDGSDKSNAVILGAQIGLVPGVWLSGEASHFDLDSGGGDNGWLYISRLQFTF
jgi:hypothetical protein